MAIDVKGQRIMIDVNRNVAAVNKSSRTVLYLGLFVESNTNVFDTEIAEVTG